MTSDERNELVEQNLGLAGRAARSFLRSHRCRIVGYDDMFQAAVTGMLIAADSFDPEKAGFSTWAWKWMYAEMQALVADIEPILSTSATCGATKGTESHRLWHEANEQRGRPDFDKVRVPCRHEGRSDMRIDVAETLERLGEKLSIPVMYHFGFKDGSLGDAADECGVSRQSACVRKNHGLMKLRGMLKSYDGEAA